MTSGRVADRAPPAGHHAPSIGTKRVLSEALLVLARDDLPVTVVGSLALNLGRESRERWSMQAADVDIGLDLRSRTGSANVGGALAQAGFEPDIWARGRWWLDGVALDVLVPECQGSLVESCIRTGGAGGEHPVRTARALEVALVDRSVEQISTCGSTHVTKDVALVAGPGATFVCKLHKIHDRIGRAGYERLHDAMGVYMLLRFFLGAGLPQRVQMLLSEDLSRPATNSAMTYLGSLFGNEQQAGGRLLQRYFRDEGIPPGCSVGECCRLANALIGSLTSP